MEIPSLYMSNNGVTRKDAIKILDEYSSEMKWKKHARILDIGCADGSITMEILQKYLPKDYKYLVGCDVSKHMIKYANEKYINPSTYFIEVDIEGTLPEELKGVYDHIFSFYTLHWIYNQRLAFENIFELLSEDGNCLLMFLGNSPVFDIYRILSRNTKWAMRLKNAERFVSPYHDSKEPEEDVAGMMKDIGFKNIHTKCIHTSYVYKSAEHLKNLLVAVNPFKLSKDLHSEYSEACVEVVRESKLMDLVVDDDNGQLGFRINYSLIIAYGSKN